MATLAQLEQAFIAADDAGNTEDAQAFANEIAKLRLKPAKQYQTPAPETVEDPSLTGWLKREANMFARGGTPVLAGATTGALAGMPAGPVGMGAGALVGGLGGSLLKPLTNKMFPAPETPGERALEAAGGAVAGAGTQLPALAGLAANATSPMVRGISDTMARNAGTQLAVAGPSAAAGKAVEEKTDSPLLGMLASIGTSLAGGKMAQAFNKAAPAPSLDQLKAEAHRQYAVAKDSGVVVRGDAFSNAVKNIEQEVKRAGYNSKLHPRVQAALEALSESDADKTLADLDILRRVARNASASQQPDERRISELVIDGIDDFIDGLNPNVLASGDADVAVPALTSARQSWAKAKKLETVQDVMERAENSMQNFSQSGLENNLRTQFRQLLNNKKAMRQFTKDEAEAIKAIVRGDAPQNFLRWMGKLAPRGVVSAALGAGGGAAIGGGPGAVLVPTVGEAARAGAAQMSMNKYNALEDLIRRGFTPQRLSNAPQMTLRGLLAGSQGLLSGQ